MIDGIGGAFLFSNDTKRLASWYRDCLGLIPAGEDVECGSIYRSFEYRDLSNPDVKRTMVWAIIPTTDDIAGKPRTGKINYTVSNLREVIAHLASHGVAVDKTEDYPYGKFAWLKDPDGNAIELWEPAADE